MVVFKYLEYHAVKITGMCLRWTNVHKEAHKPAATFSVTKCRKSYTETM